MRGFASFRHTVGRSCDTLGVFTVDRVEMHLYELDWPDKHDVVASLFYGSIDIPLSCRNEWECVGTSAWIAATSGGGAVAAWVQVRIETTPEPTPWEPGPSSVHWERRP